MKGMNRRRFLQIAGTGSVVVAAGTAASVPALTSASRLSASSKQGTYTFRAVAGLPSKNLPPYASYVIEGHVNLTTQTGAVTKTLFAGAPGGTSTIAVPGQSRIIRITAVQVMGGTFHLQGVIDDRSQLQRWESRNFTLMLDPTGKRAITTEAGTEIVMQLEG